MIIYLSDDDNTQTKYLKILNTYKSDSIMSITFSLDEKISYDCFETYFHFRECEAAINYLNDTFNLGYGTNGDFFWNNYYLNISTRNHLESKIRSIRLKEVVIGLRNDFIQALNDNRPNNINHDLFTLGYKLFEAEGLEISLIANYLNERSNDNSNIENHLGKVIENWKPGEPKLYLSFIEYFYLKARINENQTFTLFLYLIRIYTSQQQKRVKLLFSELIINFFTDIGVLAPQNIAIKIVIKSIKNIIPIIQKIHKDYNDFELSEISNYHSFKKSIWEFIHFEKERLSEEQFNQKYRSFEWFNKYTFN